MDDIAKQFISASEYKVRYIDREHICAMLFLSAQTLATARARAFNNANALTISDMCRLFCMINKLLKVLHSHKSV